MKIRLDKNGHLWLERAGKMKQVECPYSYNHYMDDFRALCGDWCAKFRENSNHPIYKNIEVCGTNTPYIIEDFTDERDEE
jgi:hypothetical protein